MGLPGVRRCARRQGRERRERPRGFSRPQSISEREPGAGTRCLLRARRRTEGSVRVARRRVEDADASWGHEPVRPVMKSLARTSSGVYEGGDGTRPPRRAALGSQTDSAFLEHSLKRVYLSVPLRWC